VFFAGREGGNVYGHFGLIRNTKFRSGIRDEKPVLNANVHVQKVYSEGAQR